MGIKHTAVNILVYCMRAFFRSMCAAHILSVCPAHTSICVSKHIVELAYSKVMTAWSLNWCNIPFSFNAQVLVVVYYEVLIIFFMSEPGIG